MMKNKRRVIGVIPARYQSSRFPAKLLAKIGEKSVLEWVYLRAKKSKNLDALLIATNDQRIFAVAEQFGAPVHMTADYHITGTERIAELADHYQDYQIVVNIQGDEPGIQAKTIDAVVDLKIKNPQWSTTTAAYRTKDSEEIDNLARVKVVFNQANEALYFSRLPIPYTPQANRDHFIHAGLYAYEKDFLLKLSRLPPSLLEKAESLEQLRILESGERIGIALVEKSDSSIDTPEDLRAVTESFRKKSLI